jgi:hypothetical protein
MELAVLEMSADEASYQADRETRDAQRAAQRFQAAEQVSAMREKASSMMSHACFDGVLLGVSALSQGVGAAASYKADKAKACEKLNPKAELVARITTSVTNLDNTAMKVNDLSYSAREEGLDASSAEHAQAAEQAKDRADDANAARQRTLTLSDQKMGVIQEMLRSDADLMHTLISRS